VKLALFDDHRLGVVTGAGIVDVTGALPWPHEPDPLTAGWWRRLCLDFAEARGALQHAAANGTPRPAGDVRPRAPVLNPSKIVACASTYASHMMTCSRATSSSPERRPVSGRSTPATCSPRGSAASARCSCG
jgi:hypothetical protein